MPTTFNLSGGTSFPEGMSVGAYPRSAWGVESVSGAPSGSATATATVTSGVAAFTGLTTNTQYYAYASVSGQPRIKGFNTADPPSSGGGTPADGSLTTAMLQDGAVTARKASDLLRTGGWLPPGAIAETIRNRYVSNNFQLVTGQPFISGGMLLPGGRTVSSITFFADSISPSGLTNQFFFLADTSRNVLATTLDDTTTAWTTGTAKTLQIASTLGGGSAGTYTPANAIEVYVGICVSGTTVPNIKANNALGSAIAGVTPLLGGTIGAASGFTTPASLASASPLAAATAQARILYAYVS